MDTTLGCAIANYGAGGFGTDQAYLKYKALQPKVPFVIFGIYPEMVRRNLAASWRFYDSQKRDFSTMKPYFIINNGKIEQVPLPQSNTVEAIREYHWYDRYYYPFRISFPYSLSLLKVAYFRMSKKAFDHYVILPKESLFEDDEALRLQALIMEAARTEAIGNGAKVAVLFFPHYPQDVTYTKPMKQYQNTHPEDCIIDPGPAIGAFYPIQPQHALKITSENDVLRGADRHYNEAGNAIIARVVAATLQSCGYVRPAQ